MQYQSTESPNRLHPLVAVASVSVALVSLLGIAAITGVLPNSHGSVNPTADLNAYPNAYPNTVASTNPAMMQTGANADRSSAPVRYMTPDGQLLEPVANTQLVRPIQRVSAAQPERIDYQPAPAVHHKVVHQKVVHHYVQNDYPVQTRTIYQQPTYVSQQSPTQTYLSDMHPVGTGVGAVVGGLVGNQIGGGNGKKLATVAGVLLGGYTGNEVAHNRNPLPW
jgi:uncharacterized protein YcfJ